MEYTILYKKALKKYGTYTAISKIFQSYNADKMSRKDKIPQLSQLAKYCDLENVLGYTYEDFCEDYPSIMEKYKLPKIYYNISIKGKSIEEYSAEKKINNSVLYKILKEGRESVVEKTRVILLEVLEIDFDINDINEFELILEENYCKLFGEKEKLEKFREKYNITYPVLLLGARFHLAFDGSIFYKIKKSREIF